MKCDYRNEYIKISDLLFVVILIALSKFCVRICERGYIYNSDMSGEDIFIKLDLFQILSGLFENVLIKMRSRHTPHFFDVSNQITA